MFFDQWKIYCNRLKFIASKFIEAYFHEVKHRSFIPNVRLHLLVDFTCCVVTRVVSSGVLVVELRVP